MPRSLWWFVVTVIIVALQIIPFLGGALLIVAGPLSIVTINAGFAFLALEAYTTGKYRVWLLAPALYFGGYFAVAAYSHYEFAELDREARAANSGQTITFSSSNSDIVIADLSRNNSLTGVAIALTQHYGLPAAYEKNSNFGVAAHLAHRIGKAPLCATIQNNQEAAAARITAFGIFDKGAIVEDLCAFHGPENPKHPPVVISAQQTKVTRKTLTADLNQIEIRAPYGPAIHLKSGYAAPFPWLPQPILGCGLFFGSPSWPCIFIFNREPTHGFGAADQNGGVTTTAIANALRLSPLSLSERRQSANTALPEALTHSMADRFTLSIRNLDRLIADPTERLNLHDVAGLHIRLDLWQTRIPAMLATLDRAINGDHRTRDAAITLQGLLNKLSTTEYRATAELIIATLATRPQLAQEFVATETMKRLGELGPAAIPVLSTNLKFDKSWRATSTILGLCQIGFPAAEVANLIADALSQALQQPNRDTLVAAVVTLQRMGRPDLTANITPLGQYEKEVIQGIRAQVTTTSAPDVCMDHDAWNRKLSRPRSKSGIKK
ncbi:MAG: hypothetical protein ABL898_18570 [Hyphomicrobiaceae bacterium]